MIENGRYGRKWPIWSKMSDMTEKADMTENGRYGGKLPIWPKMEIDWYCIFNGIEFSTQSADPCCSKLNFLYFYSQFLTPLVT